MEKTREALEVENYEQLTAALCYLLAGLESHTDGHEIVSVTIQQAGFSAFRVVIRAISRPTSGDPVRVVGFSNGSEPTTALLYAERAYRENVIRWSVDRFSKSVSDNGKSKNEKPELNIID